MYKLLHTCSVAMKKNRIGRKLHDFFVRIGLRDIVHIIKSKWVQRNSKEDENATRFFVKNAERIKQVEAWLTDDLSKEVYRKMIKYRCTRRYADLPKYNFSNQYFIKGIFKYSEGERFVDCGAYDGDTITSFKSFMKKIGIKKYSFVCFEPDEANFSMLKQKHPEGIMIQAGCWDDSTDFLCFEQGAETAGRIIENANSMSGYIKVPVIAIDNCKECERCTFIKMDIEGSEYNALRGAEKTIKAYKPKLAICIYHSNEDMIRLPELIHGFVPEYKLRIRQHSNSEAETVLYASLE